MISGPVLLVILTITILFIIFMTGKIHMHAFLVLLLASFMTGFLTGMPPEKILDTVSSGFGGMLGYFGIVIVAGAIIGTILEKSGGTIVLANSVLNLFGQARAVLAMSFIGAIVSIPVFCDSGFVILSPLNHSLAKKTGFSMTTLAVALASGLYATHTLVPPTPGPIAAAAQYDADLAYVILLGIITAIPGIIVAYFWATRFASRYHVEPQIIESKEGQEKKEFELPGIKNVYAPILLPILLISMKSIVNYPGFLADGLFKDILIFLGEPIVALIVGVFLAFRLFPAWDEKYINGWIGEGLKKSASIIMITGAGAAFGAVLKASGIGDYLGQTLSTYHLGIFLPFIVAAALKTAQGSSTVALITTSALLAPLLPGLGLDSSLARVLVVLATGAGAMTFSHANDSFFWVVSQFSNIDTVIAYKTFSMATFWQGLTTILFIAMLSTILI